MSGEQASAARARIVESAIHLLADRGVERVNTNQVAKAAGVGVGTFYSHFADKYELIQAIVLQALEALGERVEAASSKPVRDRETQVRQSVEAVVAYAEERPDLFRVAFGREPSAASGRPTVAPSTRPLERRLRGLQVQGLLDPQLEPGVAAKAFTAMQNAVLIWWLEDRDRAQREEVVETLVRMHPAVTGSQRV